MGNKNKRKLNKTTNLKRLQEHTRQMREKQRAIATAAVAAGTDAAAIPGGSNEGNPDMMPDDKNEETAVAVRNVIGEASDSDSSGEYEIVIKEEVPFDYDHLEEINSMPLQQMEDINPMPARPKIGGYIEIKPLTINNVSELQSKHIDNEPNTERKKRQAEISKKPVRRNPPRITKEITSFSIVYNKLLEVVKVQKKMLLSIDQIRDDQTNQRSASQSNDTRDIFDQFGSYVAHLLRNMSCYDALAIQPKLIQFIQDEQEKKRRLLGEAPALVLPPSTQASRTTTVPMVIAESSDSET